jgi:hypothetical protein
MQYDSPITSASFQSFLDTASVSQDTAAAISALLNLDTAETVNYAAWDGVTAPVTPTGQTADADVVVATIAGAATDLVNVDLPDSLASAKAYIFDTNASLNVTIDAPVAAEASLARVAVAAAPTTDFGLVVSSGAGNDVITVKGDQNTFVDGGNGNDTIVTGNGNNTVLVGEGNNNVTTGTGNDTIVLDGVAGNTNIVNAGAGYDVVQLTGSAADYTYAAGNHNNVTLTGDQTAVISDAEFLTFTDGSTVALAHSDAEAAALRLYEGLLGRDAELEGAKYFSAQVEAGTSLTDITNQFLTSSEFSTKEAATHVNDLYLSLLGRDTTGDAGANDWAGAVANGSASLSDVAAAIAVSAEAQTVDASNGTFIHDLYTNVLGRDGATNSADESQWVSALFNGASRADVAASITSSTEATAHTDSQFLDTLYQNALGRTADDAGKSDWATALANGATHADVAIAIVGSAEAVAHNDNVVVLHGAV